MRHRCGLAVGVAGAVLGLALVCGAEEPAPAAAESEYGRPGAYAGLGLVWAPSVFDLDRAERAVGASLTSSNQFGLDARAGYRVAPRAAVEGQYQFVPGFAVDRRGGGSESSLDTHAFTVNGKVFAMTGDTIQPYALGGIGFLHVSDDRAIAGFDASGTGFTGRVGVGADYYLRPDVVLNVEFTAVLPTGPVSDVRFLPLVFGAQYRF